MSKHRAGEDQNLFPFAVVPREPEPESVLTLVQKPESVGVQTPRKHRSGRPKRMPLGVQPVRVGAQKVGSGRPAGGFDSSEEGRYMSRIERDRPNVRLNRKLLKIVKKECKTVEPALKLQDVMEDGLRLWLKERAQAKLDAQTPTCSSSGSSCLNEEFKEDPNLTTTTTTTVGVQTPKVVALPGFAASVLEHQPHKSRYSLDINLAYGWEMHQQDKGIRNPDAWAMSNWRRGNYDPLIDVWVERKRIESEAEAERTKAAERQDQTPQREEPSKEQQELWDKVLEVVRTKLDPVAMSTWFAPIRFEGVDDSTIHLRAPNQLVKDRVVESYGQALAEALDEVKLTRVSIAWTIGLR